MEAQREVLHPPRRAPTMADKDLTSVAESYFVKLADKASEP